MPLSGQFKIMLLVNVSLGVAFLATNLLYDYFGNKGVGAVSWSPLTLTFYNDQLAMTMGDVGFPIFNFSFYFFWVVLIVNIIFLFKLDKSNN
jgi:hypothetical protein